VPAGRFALFGERISAGRKSGHVAATFRLVLTKEWVATPQGNYKTPRKQTRCERRISASLRNPFRFPEN
jgi:hypothetical protein